MINSNRYKSNTKGGEQMPRKYGNIEEVMYAWWNHDGWPKQNYTQSVWWPNHSVIYSYGEHYALAYRIKSGEAILNLDRYSVTTSCHQTRLSGRYGRKENTGIPMSFLNLKRLDVEPRAMQAIDAVSQEQLSDYDCQSRIEMAETYQRVNDKYGNFATVRGGHSRYNNNYYVTVSVKPHMLFEYDKFQYLAGSGPLYWHYWLCKLPERYADIMEAVKALEPQVVTDAKKNGLDVKRIGKYYFIPRYHGKQARKIYRNMIREFPYDRAMREGEVPISHPYKYQWNDGERMRYSDKSISYSGGWPWITRGCIHDDKVLVSGSIHHEEHRFNEGKLSYSKDPIIFEVVQNRSLDSVSTMIYDRRW
jgi:hypothetical protein